VVDTDNLSNARPMPGGIGSLGIDKGITAVRVTVQSPLFSRISIRSLNARIESQENWMAVQNGKLGRVGGGYRDKYSSCSLCLKTPTSPPRASRSLRLLFLSRA